MAGFHKRIFTRALLTWFALSWSSFLSYSTVKCSAYTTTTFVGDTSGTAGTSLQTISYTPNDAGDRNQYTGVSTPSMVLTTGQANTAASVTINGQPAADRQGDYFAHQTGAPNTTGPTLVDIEVAATESGTTNSISRTELVTAANQVPTHDADGNLTFDGYRDFAWDAKNRLLSIQTRDALVPEGAKNYRVDYAYDYMDRRIQRVAQLKIGNEWYVNNSRIYLYDGWNIVAEVSENSAGTNKQLEQSYLWGLDISNSPQGAGGVGGLLAIERHIGSQTGLHFSSCDGNGNVVALTNAADGTQSASYEYDPFGNLLECSGVFAKQNPYRFSTKRQDALTGLYYYGYRSYNPQTGRWLNRDPIGEDGGLNLYGFIGNDPVSDVDYLGMYSLGDLWNGIRNADYTWLPDEQRFNRFYDGIVTDPSNPTFLESAGVVAFNGFNGFGLVSLWEGYSGEDFVTGEKLTMAQRRWRAGLGGAEFAGSATGVYQVAKSGVTKAVASTALVKCPIKVPKVTTGAGKIDDVIDVESEILEDIIHANRALPAPNRRLSQIDEFVDLTQHRSAHILNRHRAGAGKAGKTEFPADWSDERILHQVSDVATDPNAVRGVGRYNSPYATATRDGIEIRVDFYPPDHPRFAGQISTAYPTNVPANP